MTALNEGLTDEDVQAFLDSLLKANVSQLSSMQTSIKGEIAQRRMRGETGAWER